MTIAIIIAVYILGVFAARESNRILCKMCDDCAPVWSYWFLSWACFIACLLLLTGIKIPKFKSNWFTGKYWKKNEK